MKNKIRKWIELLNSLEMEKQNNPTDNKNEVLPNEL